MAEMVYTHPPGSLSPVKPGTGLHPDMAPMHTPPGGVNTSRPMDYAGTPNGTGGAAGTADSHADCVACADDMGG